jgi:DNA-binding transcriptional ArsR family regulator
MSHRRDSSTHEAVDAVAAHAIAETMQALATPSRVRILAELRGGERCVNEIAAAVDMAPAAVSQQLRVLRHLGFVVGRRDGRQVFYELHDEHVAQLIDEAVGHVEHLRLGIR